MVIRYVLEWFGVVMLVGFIMILCNSNFTKEDLYVTTFVWKKEKIYYAAYICVGGKIYV